MSLPVKFIVFQILDAMSCQVKSWNLLTKRVTFTPWIVDIFYYCIKDSKSTHHFFELQIFHHSRIWFTNWLADWMNESISFFLDQHHDYCMNCLKWIISHAICTLILHINYASNIPSLLKLSSSHTHTTIQHRMKCFYSMCIQCFILIWMITAIWDCITCSNCTITYYRLTWQNQPQLHYIHWHGLICWWKVK